MLLIAKWCGFVKDEEYEKNKNEVKPLIRSVQPSPWNTEGIKITTPIVTEKKALTEQMIDLKKLIKVDISLIDNYKASYQKALSVHRRLTQYKFIRSMAQSYREWKVPTSFYNKSRPLFVYMGSVKDGQIFGVILDEIGNALGTYFETCMSPTNVNKLWSTILSLYDNNGSIQSVILFDNFYTASNVTDRLSNGDSLREIWDKDLDTFYNSEITYEYLGFTENLGSDNFAIVKSSMPSFACINRFDGKMRPNMFYDEKNNFVWNIDDDHIALIRTSTGETLKKYSITNKSGQQIAKLIAENE